MISRRGLILGGIAALVAAPAIVHASSLMKIRGVVFDANGNLVQPRAGKALWYDPSDRSDHWVEFYEMPNGKLMDNYQQLQALPLFARPTGWVVYDDYPHGGGYLTMPIREVGRPDPAASLPGGKKEQPRITRATG